MISILVFMDKKVLFCLNLRYSQSYSRNANSQSEPTAKLDFHVFKQPSLTELHFAGFRSSFLVLDYWCFHKGKGTDGHKASKSSLSLFTWAGRGYKLTIPQYFFVLYHQKEQVSLHHSEVDEPQVFYITCALCLYHPRTLPCPHCALFSFLWFYSVKCLSSLFLNSRFRSKAEFTTSPSRTDLNCARKLPFTGLLITVIELRFHASQRIITLLFISIPTHQHVMGRAVTGENQL